ncbi:hypothetical protein F9C07_1829882 [Aspergillus flavus]|uniref:Uncharacterized protein n=1 Tax=Aspergillus flavus (strain ATCC 200026 / FGSC A1120 / IAM 13836 / NRRL 3357 / JCM 12722 / SRRC 167) TaxID=332952 RepID=A0A7U2R517_ASPFN|nr:hypothetical protein F9C07_1829882 [Aspergillus flavus]
MESGVCIRRQRGVCRKQPQLMLLSVIVGQSSHHALTYLDPRTTKGTKTLILALYLVVDIISGHILLVHNKLNRR